MGLPSPLVPQFFLNSIAFGFPSLHIFSFFQFPFKSHSFNIGFQKVFLILNSSSFGSACTLRFYLFFFRFWRKEYSRQISDSHSRGPPHVPRLCYKSHFLCFYFLYLNADAVPIAKYQRVSFVYIQHTLLECGYGRVCPSIPTQRHSMHASSSSPPSAVWFTLILLFVYSQMRILHIL